VVPKQLDWEQLDSWLTPNDEFFIVQHYGQPILNEQDWRLDIGGLVLQP
jgi:DMSO/TMAO reductase YedYZ molybdopterin-dependent catalytic subunit